MTLAMVTGSVLGGLLPDIDNVHSQIGSRLPVVELIVHGCQKGIRLLSGILPRKLRENVRSLIGHRGLLHSLLVPAAMLLALPVIDNTNGIEKAFLIGMIAGFKPGHAFRWSSAADAVQCCKDPGMQLPYRRNGGQDVEICNVLWYLLSGVIGIISDSIRVYQNIAEYIRNHQNISRDTYRKKRQDGR